MRSNKQRKGWWRVLREGVMYVKCQLIKGIGSGECISIDGYQKPPKTFRYMVVGQGEANPLGFIHSFG